MGNGLILLTQVECDDDYTHLLHCSIVAFSHLIHSCSHLDDVAVQCGEIELASHIAITHDSVIVAKCYVNIDSMKIQFSCKQCYNCIQIYILHCQVWYCMNYTVK